MTNKHETREGWLRDGMKMLDEAFFKENGYELPEKLAVSCGFPKGHATAIGQCFDKTMSADETYNMFVCPTQFEPVRVLDILLHEMIHAAVGIDEGHKGLFRKLAKEFGLTGKMTATYAEEGSPLHDKLLTIADRLGPYPHAAMVKKRKPKKPNKWVRFCSVVDDKYVAVMNVMHVFEHGAPTDPWGKEMVPKKYTMEELHEEFGN